MTKSTKTLIVILLAALLCLSLVACEQPIVYQVTFGGGQAQAVEKDDFNDVYMSFRKLVIKKLKETDKYTFHNVDRANGQMDLIEEANKRYSEKFKIYKTKNMYDSRRFELFSEMDSQPDLALKACGLDFIKQICSIDQQLAHNILSLFSQAVEKDNFSDVEINFKKIVERKLELEEINSRKYR